MAVQTNIVPPTATSAPGSAFAGPLISGNRLGANLSGVGPNQGLAILMQQVTLVHSTTAVVSATAYLPKHSVLLDILVDTTAAWDSATSDTLSVGTAAAGTQYASGVDVKAAAGRIRPTFTGAQLINMLDTGSNEAIVASVTPVGSAANGQTTVTYIYAQTVNYQDA
jgi:hypothetical protein